MSGKRVQILRYDAAGSLTFTGREGELAVDLSKNTVRVHDGLTAGGTELARADLNNVPTASAATHGKMSAQQASELAQALLDITSNGGNISTNAANILLRASRVVGATAGNLVSLDADGDLVDSGVVADDTLVKNIVQLITKQINFGTAVLTDAANISWDLSTQQVARVTLGGNRTLLNPTNMVDGGTYILEVIQDIVGGRTLSFGSAYKHPNDIVPVSSTAASASDIYTFVCNGTKMRSSVAQGYA